MALAAGDYIPSMEGFIRNSKFVIEVKITHLSPWASSNLKKDFEDYVFAKHRPICVKVRTPGGGKKKETT